MAEISLNQEDVKTIKQGKVYKNGLFSLGTELKGEKVRVFLTAVNTG